MQIYYKIKPYILTTCVSFTVVSLLQVFFVDKIVVNTYLPFHIFFVCVCVNCMLFITDQFSFKKESIRVFIRVLDVVLVALFMNYIIYQMFYDVSNISFSWQEIGISIIALVFTYFMVSIIAGVKNIADVKKINKEIELRHKKVIFEESNKK